MDRPTRGGKGRFMPKNETHETERYLPAREVWARYGISAMTGHRWLRDAKLSFPKPTIINKRRYWLLADLIAWERQRSGKTMGEIAVAAEQRAEAAGRAA